MLPHVCNVAPFISRSVGPPKNNFKILRPIRHFRLFRPLRNNEYVTLSLYWNESYYNVLEIARRKIKIAE